MADEDSIEGPVVVAEPGKKGYEIKVYPSGLPEKYKKYKARGEQSTV